MSKGQEEMRAEFKVVPVEADIEMVEAGYEASLGMPDRSAHARVIEQYDAMLAAAPDTGMVAVPRELLDRLYHSWNSSADVLGPMQEIRRLLDCAKQALADKAAQTDQRLKEQGQ